LGSRTAGPIVNEGDIHMFRRYLYLLAVVGAPLALTLFRSGMIAQAAAPPSKTYKPSFVLAEQYPSPVIARTSPGAEGIGFGFEGGRVIKLDGTYHLFTTEMLPGHMSVKTRLAHWSSSDRIHWKRVATLYESSGDFTGRDPRASLWAPMPVYNTEEGQWDLFYVAYHSAPDTKTEWRANYDGHIWRAVSKVKGYGGVGGPYEDVGVILERDGNSQPWEGLMATDSFFPYHVGRRWLAFYGSANSEHLPIEHWRVGLAAAPALPGPWKRMSGVNPVNLEKRFAENPVVTRLENGYYVAVYDTDVDYPTAIGYTWSAPGDGVHWAPGRQLVVQPKGAGFWADTVRTPLGLIPEGRGQYTVFYTGYQKLPATAPDIYAGVGFVTLKEAGAVDVGASLH
jgi:hypothetical protein